MSHWKTSADFLHDLQNIFKMSGSFLRNSTSSSDGIQVQLLQKIIFFLFEDTFNGWYQKEKQKP